MNKADLLEVVSLFKTVNTATCVYKLLPARKKRMTFGTNIHFKLFFDRTGYKSFAASTSYRTFTILGMYIFFHFFSPLFKKVARVIITYSR